MSPEGPVQAPQQKGDVPGDWGAEPVRVSPPGALQHGLGTSELRGRSVTDGHKCSGPATCKFQAAQTLSSGLTTPQGLRDRWAAADRSWQSSRPLRESVRLACCSLGAEPLAAAAGHLPRMMPLGSSGGCHTIRTDVSLTSGNTSLTGGPGAARREDHVTRVPHSATWVWARATEGAVGQPSSHCHVRPRPWAKHREVWADEFGI